MKTFAKRRLVAVLVVASLLSGLGIVAYLNKGNIRAAIEQIQGNDYPGPGHGKVTITVKLGDTGEDVANSLVDAGVVKSFRTVYHLILDKNPTFFPGIFVMKKQMSSIDAVRALSDPNSGAIQNTVIKEGLRTKVIFAELSKSTGIAQSDFENFFEQPAVFGLSNSLPNIEGYLFPATYNFPPGATAKQILQIMVDRMSQELADFGISNENAHDVLTLASIIQKEARISDDFYKVSAVFKNRIKSGMPLQSDATVSYGVSGNTVSTSASDRANDNGWNTYLHAGLPVGPISAPGNLAIDAALHPAKGKWLFFCTWNLETGETIFSETIAGHEAAVAKWRNWMREHPGYE